MMLDMRRTFDEMVQAHSTPDRAATILANPFYQAISTSFSGTQEYMAMEKLGHLAATGNSSTSSSSTPRRALRARLPRRPAAPVDLPRRPHDPPALRTGPGGRAQPAQDAWRRLHAVHQGRVDDPRRTVAGRRVRVRAALRHDVRRLPGTGHRHLRPAAVAGHGLRRVAAPEPDALREAAYFVDRLRAEDCRWPG